MIRDMYGVSSAYNSTHTHSRLFLGSRLALFMFSLAFSMNINIYDIDKSNTSKAELTSEKVWLSGKNGKSIRRADVSRSKNIQRK